MKDEKLDYENELEEESTLVTSMTILSKTLSNGKYIRRPQTAVFDTATKRTRRPVQKERGRLVQGEPVHIWQ